MTDHSDIDHSGLTGVGGTVTGKSLVIVPVGLNLENVTSTNATGDRAGAAPVIIPGSMSLRSLWIRIGTSAAGSIEWGLFDYSASASAATKLAGGSAAPGGTGWREIAATGSPVTVAAGNYMLVVENPATNPSTIGVGSVGTAPGFWKAWSTYTWDDTPDFTSVSWADSAIMYMCYLEGDMNGTNRW